jgi:hypothetical protein
MAEKDYLAVWFNARRRFGIDDTIYWGWFNPENRQIDWQSWRHADGDGLSGLASEMRKIGYPSTPLPVCNETSVPSWGEITKARKANPIEESEKAVNWKQTYPYDAGQQFEPEISSLNKVQTDTLKAYAAEHKVSTGNVLFAALSKVVAKKLISGNAPFYWFFPVNVRGATGIKTESFNQVSGVAIRVNPSSTANDWQTQMRQRLKAKEHWMMWKLANLSKYFGEVGVAWFYKRSSMKQFYMGNCSNLGVWPLPHENNPPKPNDGRLLAGAAPGTANYPVSSSMIEWYGEIALTLKLHPYICPNQALVRELADAWLEEVLANIQPQK